MLDQLLPYYKKELAHLRRLPGEFAHRYPKIARRLVLEDEQCEDPHVERLIEGFAFLAARIHKKLDDEYPEISEAFWQTLYPHYTRPFASTTILRFELDEAKPEITDRHSIARGQTVLSPPVNGAACKCRTARGLFLVGNPFPKTPPHRCVRWQRRPALHGALTC